MWLGAGSFASAPFKVSNAGDLTATSVTASDVFVTGVSITPSTTTSAINMNSASSATSTFTMGTNGVVRTSSSYPRVELAQSGSDSFAEFFNSSGSPQLQVGLNAGTNSYIVSNSNPLTIFATGTTDSESTMNLNANVINLTKGSSVGRPKLLIDGGTSTTTLNKSLGIDVNGNIAFGTVAAGYTDWEIFTSDTYRASVTSGERVTWNAGSGLSVGFNATNQVITYSANFGGSAGQISEGNHTHSYDNYGSWSINGNTVSSGQGVTIQGQNDISVSTSGRTITIEHDDNDHSFTSGITSVNGATGSSGALTLQTSTSTNTFTGSWSFINSSTIQLNKSTAGYISTGYPSGSSPRIGTSSSDRFSNIYSQSFYGTFYGQNINASSRNIKENIVDTALGLDFINDLTVKDFTMIDTDTFGTSKYTGFIAEDVQQYLTDNSLDYKLVEDYSSTYEYNDRCSHVVICECGMDDCLIQGCEEDCCSEYYTYTDEDGNKQNFLHATVEECEAYMPDENRHPHLYFNNFIGPLVKAVQELSTQISDLTARIEALEG